MSLDLLAWNMEREGKDPMRALANLVHLCREHDMARCQLVAAFLLSVWQLTGRAFSETVPSFMLVNCNPGSNQVWMALTGVLQACVEVPERPPARATCNSFVPGLGNSVLCRQTMLAYMARIRTLRTSGVSPALVEAEIKKLSGNWTAIKADLFPQSSLRQLRKAFDSDFGFISPEDDCISLLVPDSKNRTLLRKMLDTNPALYPMAGVGDSMEHVPKRVSLIGTVPAREWDARLTSNLLRSSLPVLFLPCDSPATMQLPDVDLLRLLVLRFTRHFRSGAPPVHSDPSRVEVDEDSLGCLNLILRLSGELPGDAAFRIQFLLRQLYSVVNLLTAMAAPTQASLGTSTCEPDHVARDLYVTALRGIAYGIAALRFHCIGLPSLENDKQAADALAYLRNANRPVRRRDIQRKVYTLMASERDELISRLDEAGLVTVKGKYVEAVRFPDYLSGIPRQEGFPEVTLLTREHDAGKKEAKSSAA